MEDDIDIEEHDVLDNPRIRTIFPDIAQIKAEIPDNDYHDPDQEMEYHPYSTDEHPGDTDEHPGDTDDHPGDTDDHPGNQDEEDASEYTRFQNKIILGRKRSSILEQALTFGRMSIEVKQELEEYDGTGDEDIHEEHYNQSSSVLILGSKPSSAGVITPFTVNDVPHEHNEHLNATSSFMRHEVDPDEMDLGENEVVHEFENGKEPRDLSAAVVLVENWGPRLENNSCYCNECQILFPTSNTLLAHNMTAHSFLVALDKNKAVKSTSKSNAKKVETGKLCNHCNKMFPDSDTLINHLYMIFDKNNAVSKKQPKKVVSNPFNKQVNANLVKTHKRDVTKSSKPVQVYAQGATDLFRCEVCSYYCEMYRVFVRHMSDNHSRSTFNQEKEIFDGTCPHCNSVLKSKLVYNRHIQFVHSEIYNLNSCDENELLYRCDICSYYVEMNWALVRHMKQSHRKFSVDSINQEKRVFDGECPHCSSEFKTKRNYNRHMKQVHNNWFNLKSGLPSNKRQMDKTPTPKKIPVIRESNDQKNKSNTAKLNYNACKFQCLKCGDILMSYDKARQHRQVKHPELKTMILFKKIISSAKTVGVQKGRVAHKIALKYPKKMNINKKNTLTKELDVLPSTSKSPQKNNQLDVISKPPNQIIIPKYVIFKCNKCDIHFTSCTATVLHSKLCGTQKEDWKCNICNRMFQTFDQTVHKRQHQVSEKFNVIVFHENIYGRILNQCPNCKLYFHEKEFYLHDQKKYCRGAGVKCEKCSNLIHISSVETHSKWHERSKSNKKNMILVEFASLTIEKTSSTPSKRVLDMDDDSEASTIPTKKPKIEKSQGCKKYLVKYCQKCGVFMFNSRHVGMHISGKCKTIPNSSKKICKICGLTYKSITHMGFHKTYPNLTLMDMRFLTVKERLEITPPIPNFPGCSKCKVHFCKKDTVATHSCKDSYKTCKYCKKRYSDLAYKLHMKFHEYHAKFKATKSAERNGFIEPSVLQNSAADPMPELLKKYEMFTNTWNILFSCSSCDIVCDNYDIVVEHCQKHFNNMESYDMMIQYCEICELKFDGSCFERHNALHAQNESVNKDYFTVVNYQYRNLLKMKWLDDFYRLIPETQMQQILSKSIYNTCRSIKLRVVKEGPPENTIYRCGQCELFIHPQSLASHYRAISCKKDTLVYNCGYCGIPFCTLQSKTLHERSHKTAKEFNVVYLNETGDEEFNKNLAQNGIVRLKHAMGLTRGKGYHYYRCAKCKCCMKCKNKAVIHKCAKATLIEQCNLCQLHFYKKLLSRHIKLHETNPKLISENIKCTDFERGPKGVVFQDDKEEKTVVKLYRCHCGLHFTSTMAIHKHFKECGVNDDVIKERCSKCTRLFDTNQLVTHLCKHHSKDNDEDTEFEIIVLSPGDGVKSQETLPKAEETVGRNIVDKRKNLFKCQKCDVYYLSQGGLAYHFETNHQVYKVTKCPHCKLKFMPQTLQKHITIQHKTLRCKLADFVIYFGVNDRGRLRFHKSPLSIERGDPCEKIVLREGSPIFIKDGHRNVDMSLYDNKLYKCKTCDMHLLTWPALNTHRERNKQHHSSELLSCPECGYGFSRHSLPRHYYVHHEKNNLKREEFNIVYWKKDKLSTDDSSDDETDCSKIDHDAPDDAEKLSDEENYVNSVQKSVSLQKSENTKEGKTDSNDGWTKLYKITSILFECAICNMICSENYLPNHFKNHSTNEVMPAHLTCLCGLKFSAKKIAKHENLHHGIQNLTRDDLYIIKINLHDGVVGSNHLFKCEICPLHFCTMNALQNHLSSVEHCTQTKACTHCGLSFTMTGIGVHQKLHHDAMKLRREDLVVLQAVGDSDLKVIDATNNDFNKTELIKNSVVEHRRLYRCCLCSTHYLNLDDLSLCKHETALTAVCEKCHLKFCEDALEEHVEAHHTSVDFKKEDFEIIESREILEEELASTHSADISNTDKLQEEEPASTSAAEITITDNKTLDDTQDEVEKTGSILYKCNGCYMHFLHRTSLETHLIRSPTGIPHIETCEYCGLYFSKNTLKKHIKQHTAQKLTLKDFRVIDQVEAGASGLTCASSNKKKNDDVREKANEENTSLKTTQGKEAFDTDKDNVLERIITDQLKNKLYQCDKCDCCFLTFTNARDHYAACQYVQTYVKCEQCELKFHKSLNMHIKLHHETQNYKLEDLVIIRYAPKKEVLAEYLESISPLKLTETYENVSTLDKTLYTNNIFKCGTCSLHFLIKESLENHTENPALKIPKSTCTFCGLAFSINTLPTHVYIHHESMKLITADFCITVKDEIMENYSQEDSSIQSESITRENGKGTCNKHSLSDMKNIESTKYDAGELDTKIIDLRDSNMSPDMALEVESSTAFSNCENKDLTYEPKMFEISDDGHEDTAVQFSSKTDATKKTDVSKPADVSKPVKLYKCAVCNVCFMTQVTCYRHTVKHVLLDPKDYIECKLCGYQFLIVNNCLHKHVTKHHKRPFKPEEVLIEEYHPDILCHGTPKINIYFGTDKLQSKLISTTSDAVSLDISENSEVETKPPDSDSLVLNSDKSPDITTANSDEGDDVATANIDEVDVKTTDNSAILDADLNSDMPKVCSAGEDVNYSDDSSSVDFDNLETISLGSTDESDSDDPNNSIIDLDLDKNWDVISLESGDRDSRTNSEDINLGKNPNIVDSAVKNIKNANSTKITQDCQGK